MLLHIMVYYVSLASAYVNNLIFSFNTRNCISPHFQGLSRELPGVWNCGKNLSQDFDISSQLKLTLRRKLSN